MSRIYKIFTFFFLLLLYGCGSGDASSDLRKAYSAAKSCNWQSALELSGKRLAVVPNDVDAAVIKALSLFYLERNVPDKMLTAVDMLKQAAKLRSDRYDVQLAYGWVLMQLGRNAEALQPLQEAYKLHLKPGKTGVMGQEEQGMVKYALAQCYLNSMNYQEAYHYLEQAAKSTPFSKSECLYNDLGVLAYSIGVQKGGTEAPVQMQRAVEHMNRAIDEYKAKLADYNAAADADKRKIELEPNICNVYANSATLCFYMSYPYYGGEASSQYAKMTIPWYEAALTAFKSRLSTQSGEQTQLRSGIASMEALLKRLKNR